jgi:hypothetical protein
MNNDFIKNPSVPLVKRSEIFFLFRLLFFSGRYIHCTDSHWSYAVEKHLAPIMASFICSDIDDEKILLEIFSLYSFEQSPPVFVRAHSNSVHDTSGTLKQIKQANLLSIHQVLRIDNMTVECALIDFKQIEATILLEDLEQVKSVRQSGILQWKKIDRKVKQVTEAWTCDGSNIKFDKAFRIYTNEKQTMKYFATNTTQSLSLEELQLNIKFSYEQIIQTNESMNELKRTRQTIIDDINKTKKASADNKRKIKDLNKV